MAKQSPFSKREKETTGVSNIFKQNTNDKETYKINPKPSEICFSSLPSHVKNTACKWTTTQGYEPVSKNISLNFKMVSTVLQLWRYYGFYLHISLFSSKQIHFLFPYMVWDGKHLNSAPTNVTGIGTGLKTNEVKTKHSIYVDFLIVKNKQTNKL